MLLHFFSVTGIFNPQLKQVRLFFISFSSLVCGASQRLTSFNFFVNSGYLEFAF